MGIDKTMHGWHFLSNSLQLGYADGRKVNPGIWIDMKQVGGTRYSGSFDRPVICKAGMHASPRIIDALKYMSNYGTVLCRVSVRGMIQERADKFCGYSRRIDKMGQVSGVMLGFVHNVVREYIRHFTPECITLEDLSTLLREKSLCERKGTLDPLAPRQFTHLPKLIYDVLNVHNSHIRYLVNRALCLLTKMGFSTYDQEAKLVAAVEGVLK